MAKPCWAGSDGTLFTSLTVTFVPFGTAIVPGSQIFDPSYSTLTMVTVIAPASAAATGGLEAAISERATGSRVTRRGMRSSLDGGWRPLPKHTHRASATLSQLASLV